MSDCKLAFFVVIGALCLDLDAHAISIPPLFIEGNISQLSGSRLILDHNDGTSTELIVYENTVFCKAGYREYSHSKFVEGTFVNILTVQVTGSEIRHAVLVYDAAIEMGFAVPVMPSCIATKYDDLSKETQELLATLGYDIGTVDGIFGEASQAALKDFESSTGQFATGIPSGAMIKMLRAAVAEKTN